VCRTFGRVLTRIWKQAEKNVICFCLLYSSSLFYLLRGLKQSYKNSVLFKSSFHSLFLGSFFMVQEIIRNYFFIIIKNNFLLNLCHILEYIWTQIFVKFFLRKILSRSKNSRLSKIIKFLDNDIRPSFLVLQKTNS
jgi:hypothetical protein